ncbi:hypothetical protein FRACYDRAFT_245323 [Fragilariopsis cylindrus CCMP1102]|uniref:Uncharacterized protein n=1 Tax=Fragilariopsis cylindrus CCMP1102 TaxID=635003 RepID=A0A1E7F029_9STRA|nr:hypothetical protein FRACYDRAFT_245323 [Fragilariopsis cylindrus CCMP1102]|eukprot:OEU11477.1 hypothetical protein FRACYDRAFT_245323 [Fragilariopsis cylindrus CCMP1102]
MNKELEKEPQLDPPRHIINQKHYVGVTTIAFKELKGIIATGLPDLQKAGINLILHRLDNETSEELIIEEIEKKGLDFQIASPGDHQLNHAGRVVQTFKITSLPYCMEQTVASQRNNGID